MDGVDVGCGGGERVGKGWKCGWGRRWMWGGWRGVGRGGNVDGVDVGCGVGKG